MSRYDWDVIPLEFNYAATTSQGGQYAFVIAPEKCEFGNFDGYWRAMYGGSYKVKYEPVPPKFFNDWQTSLEVRPGWEEKMATKEAEIWESIKQKLNL